MLLTEKEDNFLGGLLDFRKFKTLHEFFVSIIDNWEVILFSDLLPVHQAIVSYVLMIYFHYPRLDELYTKYPTIEVASNFIPVLTRQGQKEKIMNIISSFSEESINEALIISQIDLLIWKSYFHIHYHEFTEAKELISLAERKIDETIEKEQFQIIYYQQKALVKNILVLLFARKKSHHQAIAECKQGIKLLEDNKINDRYLLGTLYNSYGNALDVFGDPSAGEKFEIALEHFTKNNIKRGMAVCQGNIASLMIKEGRFEKSLEYCLLFIEIMEKFQDQRNILITYNLIYSSLKSLGRMEEAEKYLTKAFEHMDKYKLENDEIYLDASEFYALIGDFKLAERNIDRYYELLKVDEKETMRRATWLMHKGFIELKKKNIYRSEQQLRDGIRIAKKQRYATLVLQGLIYTIELLLTKYRVEENQQIKQKIIDEIELHSQEIVILLREHKSIFQMVNYEILLATVYILTLKLRLASDILRIARSICERYNLQKQLEEIKEKEVIVKSLLALSEQSEREKEILQDQSKFEHTLGFHSTRGVKDATYISTTEEKQDILYLLIILPSGLPCYSYNFKKERLHDDELLIAGLINAIQKFSSEISIEKGVFRMLQHSDYLLLLEPRETFTIALFTENFAYKIKENIILLADKVEEEDIDTLEKRGFIKTEELLPITTKLDELLKEIFVES
ncbi:hypothetical protein ES705_15097 [subsurface metagenome]